jgi:Lar family restriction alleviation protein
MKERKMSEELKPCMFCGEANDVFSNVTFANASQPIHYIECGRCSAMGPSGKTDNEAVTAWNTRALEGIANPAAIGEVVEALHRIEGQALCVNLRHDAAEADDWLRSIASEARAALAKLDNEGEE